MRDESIDRTFRRGTLLTLALLVMMVACGRLADGGPEAGGDERSVAGGGRSGRSVPGSTGDPGAPPDDPPADSICVDTAPDDADPDTPVVGCPGDAGHVPTPKSSPVTPVPGMADVRAVGWDRVDVAGDDRTLTIHFWSGVEPCYVLDRVDVRYGDDAVTVTLFEGHDPSADDEDMVCIEIALAKSVTIALDEPLAGRDLIDGAEA
jgi:hypothetical protein